MEGYGRHSRSHFKAAPPHPSPAVAGAGNGTGFYKKPYSNGGGAGGTAFMAYDDVFGGPPKFGATPFAPRAEDYSEIFGSFRSSRTSSIPMLDLPPVDNSVDAFEVLGCSGLEYTEIFGGFDFADFAASYDELFRRSDGSEESSDDAWTPVGTESPSEASDLYASSGRNQYFLNSDFHETPEDSMFDVSYNNVKLGTTEDTEQTDEGQHSFVPGYTYMVEGSTMRKEDEERYSSGVADDIILCEDSSGNISVETRRKTASIRSHSGVVKQSHGYEEPSHLPPLSKLRPTIDERKKDPAETIFEGGSLDFFDVELNAGSSSIAAAEAMKEAMDRAKLKLNSAKELRKREKDGVENTLFVNNGLKKDGKVKMAFDDSILRDDELQSKCESESSVLKVSGDNMQDASEASQVLPNPLQPEDEVNRAAEPAQRETANNQSLSLDPGLIEGDGEWKVTTECYEFLNSKIEHSLPVNIKKPVQEVNNCHFDNVNGRTMSLKQMEHNVEWMYASIKDHEDLKSSDEACNPRDNRRRLRATKAASRNAFHEKMLKLAQDVHKTVSSDHVETQKRRKEGIEGDGAQRSPETWSVGGKSGRIYDQAAQQVHYDRKHEEESYESYLADSEIGSDEDLVQADCVKQGKEDCKLKGHDRRRNEEVFAQKEAEAMRMVLSPRNEAEAREETVKMVVAEKGDNGREVDYHQNGEKEAEAAKRVMSPRNENLIVLNPVLEQESKGKSGKNEKQDSDVSLKKADEKSTESKNEMREEVHTADKCEKNAEAALSDCNGKILKESVDLEKCEQVDMATENIRKERINANDDHPTKSKRLERSNGTFKSEHEVDVYEKDEMEESVEMIDLERSQKMFECSAKNEELKMEDKGGLQSEFKVIDRDSNQKENLHLESEYFASIEPPTLDEEVLEMAGECDELKSSCSPSSLDGKDIKSFDMASEGEEKLENHVVEAETEFCSGTLNSQIESKVAEMEEFCITSRYPQKTDGGQCMMSERKESARKQYPSSNIDQRVGKEEKAANGNVAAEDGEMDEKLRRKEDSERELLREVQLENERELKREVEKERLQKLEEEREKELLRKLEEEREKERLQKLEEEREKERLRKLEEERETERLRKLEEDREKERLRKLEEEREKERLRKLEEEREKDKEKELEKLRLRRLEELRERERLKELEKDHLQKLEEERQKERQKDLEKERLRKLEEEWEREREREKDRMGVELKMPAAHERAAVERATVEARQRAMSEARERLEKVCAEAREKSFGKTSKEAQLRAERAAVERATAEARERAIGKAMTRDRVERSVSEKFSSSFREVELRHCSSSNDLWSSDKSDGVEGESAQRCKARLDRHRRTVERVAKALAEKNMRDLIAQREQTERNRFAETLDADIKRWSNGKEGNLRALLSTLQYILGSESGWQPIPLTEVITSAAVKKAYRKATLCVHPDKLQQRGATIQQKYICEKVFDLLKDGWNRFNSEER